MNTLKVLIVDDSLVYRTQIRKAIGEQPWIQVVGSVPNGLLAIEKLKNTSVDLVILDLEMPEMDGLATLKEISIQKFDCKVLVFSSASKRGADITLEALRLGATDFVMKPGPSDAGLPSEKIKDALEPKILALFPKFAATDFVVEIKKPYANQVWDLIKPRIIVIGASTGGPTVLEKIFETIRAPLACPIVIAQHMPAIFTASLAERIQRICGIPTQEAVHGEYLENIIYIVPGDYHMRLVEEKGNARIQLDQGPRINYVRPAVDPLFETAAAIYKDKCLGLILTGMGSDGKLGAEKVKQSGGAIVIQNEESCVVFGMPGAVFAAGAYDKIQSPDEIVQTLTKMAMTFSSPKLNPTGSV